MDKNIHKRLLLFIITSVFVLACCGSVSAASQPDLEIKNVTDSQYIGNTIYNNTTTQTKMGFANNTTAAVYNIKIQNNGNTTDSFNITATTTDSSWTVKYFDALTGGNDITSSITGDGWIVNLASGASKEFRVEVTAPSDYTGYVNNVILTAVSVSNSTLTDSVVSSTMAVISSNKTLPELNYPKIGDIILEANDDDTTDMITLPFNVTYYGNTYNSLWVNNNGYVKFTTDDPDETYNAEIPNNAGVMLITPFWNDIYTGISGNGHGYVHCKLTDDLAVFTWDNVTQYITLSGVTPFYNTFQLILTKSGFVGFSYGDMQWADDGYGDHALAGFNFGNDTSSVIFKQFNTTADVAAVANQTFWFYVAGNAPVQVSAADIAVSQTVDKTSAKTGSKVTFTVTVKNNGPGTAANVQIRDVIPPELSNVVVTPSVGTYNSATGVWTIGDLQSGASVFLTITGTIKESGMNINNAASRIETGTYYDAVRSNDLASSSVTAEQDPSNDVVNAAESVETVPMQKTGVPLQYIVMAVLMVLGGVLVPRKK